MRTVRDGITVNIACSHLVDLVDLVAQQDDELLPARSALAHGSSAIGRRRRQSAC
jgi:hypothetical protein